MEIAIIGGTGFIGQHLVKRLVDDDRINNIRMLTRKTIDTDLAKSKKIKNIKGDIQSLSSLNKLLVEGATVINLAYLEDVGCKRNIEYINKLVDACKKSKVQRLLHCSTAVVSGRATDHLITEETPCKPYSTYEKTKLKIETILTQQSNKELEVVILRPTAVFGVGGRNLNKLAHDLYYGSRIKNYIKSCLYGARTMNLVSVSSVVSALLFLVLCDKEIGGENYIIANDDVDGNDYISIEEEFIRVFGMKQYIIPRVILPRLLLRIILMLMHISNIDDKRIYSTNKLEKLGWENTKKFNEEIKDYALWLYNSTYKIR